MHIPSYYIWIIVLVLRKWKTSNVESRAMKFCAYFTMHAKVLRKLHNEMYKRYSRKLCKNIPPNIEWTLLYNTRDAKFPALMHTMHFRALIDWRRLTVIASFYLYGRKTLWTGFSKSFVCLFAQKKNRFIDVSWS